MAEAEQEQKFDAGHKPMSWLRLGVELVRTLQSSIGDPLPSEFRQHMRASRKESLLAMRSLIDAHIARMEAKEEAESERTATKITIQ
jgi:hypothetical protein